MIDSALALSLTAAAIAGWWWALMRRDAPFWAQALALPAMLWLGWYGLCVLDYIRPVWWSGRVAMGAPTFAAMLGGLMAASARRQPPKRRGRASA